MDVSPWISRLFQFGFIGSLIFSLGCGNRFDLSTERGRRSRIDEANFQLSQGNCSGALETIDHLYNSPEVNDEVRIIKASAHACAGTFNLFTFIGNLTGATNYFSALAKSLTNTTGDGARSSFYVAVDTLTRNGALLDASGRSTAVNDYMIFLQLGVIASILRNYGNPATDGSQVADLEYEALGADPADEMSNEDACALAASLSIITDSYSYSSLNDSNTASVVSSLNSLCATAGLASCGVINKSRSACDGTDAESIDAAAVVAGIDASW